eukprot:scaffold871_cov130-Cylindrotheca_fusiformis.AAC.25
MRRDETGGRYKELLLLGKRHDDIPLESERFADLEERIDEHQEALEGLEKQKEHYSRAAVERMQKEILDQISEAANMNDFLKMSKKKFPTLSDLNTELDSINFYKRTAVLRKEWLAAKRLQTELDRLEVSILRETNAENDNLVDAERVQVETQAS